MYNVLHFIFSNDQIPASLSASQIGNDDELYRLCAGCNRRFEPESETDKSALGEGQPLRRHTHLANRVGYCWITRALIFVCYILLTIPGIFQVGYYYFFSSQIHRGIVYGDQPRNKLDLYLPKNRNEAKPVVALVTGGGWILGYRAWASILAIPLFERDVIVACIDYRNFPQGTIGDMVKDVSEGISFLCNNIGEYGGDPSRIYILGQSAGAHIAACVLLEQATKEVQGEKTCWSVSRLKKCFGISGGYNLSNLVDHFHNLGFYRSIFLSIMEGEESLRKYSPEVMVQEPNVRRALSLLPPIILIHGTADESIPSDSSKSFADTLQRLGAEADSILYEGKSHADLFVQDPMRGGVDVLVDDLAAMIHDRDDTKAPPKKRLVPEFMLRLAWSFRPF